MVHPVKLWARRSATSAIRRTPPFPWRLLRKGDLCAVCHKRGDFVYRVVDRRAGCVGTRDKHIPHINRKNSAKVRVCSITVTGRNGGVPHYDEHLIPGLSAYGRHDEPWRKFSVEGLRDRDVTDTAAPACQRYRTIPIRSQLRISFERVPERENSEASSDKTNTRTTHTNGYIKRAGPYAVERLSRLGPSDRRGHKDE